MGGGVVKRTVQIKAPNRDPKRVPKRSPKMVPKMANPPDRWIRKREANPPARWIKSTGLVDKEKSELSMLFRLLSTRPVDLIHQAGGFNPPAWWISFLGSKKGSNKRVENGSKTRQQKAQQTSQKKARKHKPKSSATGSPASNRNRIPPCGQHSRLSQ